MIIGSVCMKPSTPLLTLAIIIGGLILSTHLQSIIETSPPNQHLKLLTDDLQRLPELKGNVSQSEVEAVKEIRRLILSSDPEVQKGLWIISRYGVPFKAGRFTPTYRIPDYNTQLQILFWLAQDRGVEGDYSRVAVALAIDYGIVLTYGDDEVDCRVRSYVAEIYDYIRETDRILEEKGLGWRAKDYPLEADILLCWGACGMRYPTFYRYVGDYPGSPWEHFWYQEFRERPMHIDDFEWLFIKPETLREMREWLFENRFVSRDLDETADKIDVYADSHVKFCTYNLGEPPTYVEVGGRITPGYRIANPNLQWRSLRDSGWFLGDCEDTAHMDAMLLKSLNIAAGYVGEHGRRLAHIAILYYNPHENLLKTTDHQIEHINLREPWWSEVSYRYYRLGWCNLHCQQILIFVARSSDKDFLRRGIPIDFVLKGEVLW